MPRTVRTYATLEEAEQAFGDACESYGECLAEYGSSYFCGGTSASDANIMAQARVNHMFGGPPRREDYLPPRPPPAPQPVVVADDDDLPF